MEDASGRRLYVCLRCGNKFWSRAKKPQCSVCRSKRVIPYEEFLQLPQEEQERILGKKSEENGEQGGAAGVKLGEIGEKPMKSEDSPKDEKVKTEESPGETGGKSGKTGESPKIPQSERVKSGDSPKIPGVKKREKPGERVKGERVKKGFKVPVPKLSWKAWGFILGLAFIYYLYHVGWFDEMFRQLKRLAGKDEVPEHEERRKSPVLGKIESNLRG
ncbi:hypothetical protein [Thermococcus sp.]